MDIESIEELAEVLRRSTLARVEMEGPDWAIALERPVVAAHPAPVDAPVIAGESPATAPLELEPAATLELSYVEAPVVGVFHESDLQVQPGRAVRVGDPLGSIEALALRNDVRAPVDGEITAVQVEDGQPVEYGQTLFIIARFQE